MKKIIFVCGVHGAGKGTLCRALSARLGIRTYSASDIIKSSSNYIESSKFTSSAKDNQSALIKGLNRISDNSLLLDGHFCLLSKKASIVDIDFETFHAIAPSVVIYVYASVEEIYRRLLARDGTSPSLSTITELQYREKERAIQFTQERGIIYVSYSSGDSIDELFRVIRNI